MARESQLWQRTRQGGIALRKCGYQVDLARIENQAVSGHPDVEGCIDGQQIWIELKSCSRPKRATSKVRPKLRPSQDIWHLKRHRAGSRHAFVLMQVGEGADAALYLIPGKMYPHIVAPESALLAMSVISPSATLPEILVRATEGYSE